MRTTSMKQMASTQLRRAEAAFAAGDYAAAAEGFRDTLRIAQVVPLSDDQRATAEEGFRVASGRAQLIGLEVYKMQLSYIHTLIQQRKLDKARLALGRVRAYLRSLGFAQEYVEDFEQTLAETEARLRILIAG